MLGSTFEEDDLSALKIAFQNCNNQRTLAASPLMHDMQPASGGIDDYMNCSDGSSIDNNHNIMASMIMSGQSQFDDLSSSIINSQNLSPFANNFLNGLCSSPQSDMLMDASSNGLLHYSSNTSRCDSASSLLYLNGEKRSVTSTVPDSSSGSICTRMAASSTDVDDALLKSIEEADCFFDPTHSPPILDVPITSCSILGSMNGGTACSVPITSPVLSSPEDGITLHSPMNDCIKFESKSLKKLPDLPPPPKKPLSPYMRFSKGIWQKVKAANPGMTVCEVGANIGRVWRELSDTDKQRFNDEFLNDKVRYDTELQKYLQVTGLQASDLVKPRTRKKDQKEKPSSRKTSRLNSNLAKLDVVSQQLMQEVNNAADLTQQSPNEALTPVGLPSFSQVWSQPEFPGGQDTEVSGSIRGSCDGSTTFEDADDAEQLLNGISLQNSIFGQNNFCGDLQQSNIMQSFNGTGPLLNNNTWMWQQLNTNEQEQQGINRDTVMNSPQQQQVQQFKKLSNLTLKSSVNDFKNSNGIHSDLMQTSVDPEKLLLRSALVEKSQEVLKLMKELEQAYGLIHQLKQQNDFFQQHWTSMHSLQGSTDSNNSSQQLPTVSASQQTDMSPK